MLMTFPNAFRRKFKRSSLSSDSEKSTKRKWETPSTTWSKI